MRIFALAARSALRVADNGDLIGEGTALIAGKVLDCGGPRPQRARQSALDDIVAAGTTPLTKYHPALIKLSGTDWEGTSPAPVIGEVTWTGADDGKLRYRLRIEADRTSPAFRRALQRRADAGEIVENSVAVRVTEHELVDGVEDWVHVEPIHHALLPDGRGACSVDDGAGFLRAASQSTRGGDVSGTSTITAEALIAAAKAMNDEQKGNMLKALGADESPSFDPEALAKAAEDWTDEQKAALAKALGYELPKGGGDAGSGGEGTQGDGSAGTGEGSQRQAASEGGATIADLDKWKKETKAELAAEAESKEIIRALTADGYEREKSATPLDKLGVETLREIRAAFKPKADAGTANAGGSLRAASHGGEKYAAPVGVESIYAEPK